MFLAVFICTVLGDDVAFVMVLVLLKFENKNLFAMRFVLSESVII